MCFIIITRIKYDTSISKTRKGEWTVDMLIIVLQNVLLIKHPQILPHMLGYKTFYSIILKQTWHFTVISVQIQDIIIYKVINMCVFYSST